MEYVNFSDMYSLHLDFLNLCSNSECERYYDQCLMSFYTECLRVKGNFLKEKKDKDGNHIIGEEFRKLGEHEKKRWRLFLEGYSDSKLLGYMVSTWRFWIFTLFFCVG